MPTPTDFYDIDGVLAEEERAVRDSVRQFVNDKSFRSSASVTSMVDFPGTRPGDGLLGVLGANLPEEYGCADSTTSRTG
jgi:glutaryl-CoA dehydrogenase